MTDVSSERRTATAQYIEDMLVELRTMAQNIDADVLVYLLEMSMIEANDVKLGRMTPGRKKSSAEGAQSITAEQLANLYMVQKA